MRVLRVAVGAGDQARPRGGSSPRGRQWPSRLARLEVGRAGAGWIVRPEPGFAMSAARGDDLAITAYDRFSHAELFATLGADRSEHRLELRMEQIAPVIAMWSYQVELVELAGHAAAIDAIYEELPERIEWLLSRNAGRITFYQASDRTYAGYGNLMHGG